MHVPSLEAHFWFILDRILFGGILWDKVGRPATRDMMDSGVSRGKFSCRHHRKLLFFKKNQFFFLKILIFFRSVRDVEGHKGENISNNFFWRFSCSELFNSQKKKKNFFFENFFFFY